MNIDHELRRIAALGDQYHAGRAANGYVNVPQMLRQGQLQLDHWTSAGDGSGELFVKAQHLWIGMRVWKVGDTTLSWHMLDHLTMPSGFAGVFDHNTDAVLGIASGVSAEDCLAVIFGPWQPRSTHLSATALKLRELSRNPATLFRFEQMARGRGKRRLVRFSDSERDRGARLYKTMGFRPVETTRRIWVKDIG